MGRIRVVGLLAVLGGLAPHGAVAQGMDERCQRIVDALCRDAVVGQCFRRKDMWDYVPARCSGDIQAMIEMDREARQEQRQEQRQERRDDRRRAGPSFSCGGILRSQPSMTSAKVASVPEGQELESVEDAGVATDGYTWFLVRYRGLEGYHWGGIFWTQGGRAGTIPSCQG